MGRVVGDEGENFTYNLESGTDEFLSKFSNLPSLVHPRAPVSSMSWAGAMTSLQRYLSMAASYLAWKVLT